MVQYPMCTVTLILFRYLLLHILLIESNKNTFINKYVLCCSGFHYCIPEKKSL